MRNFTIAVFIFCCAWIGYRYAQGIAPTPNALQPALAQSITTNDVIGNDAPGAAQAGAKPTVAPLFRDPTRVAATPTSGPDQTPTRTLRPTAQPLTAPTVLPNLLRPAYPEMMIYDDELNPNWSIEQSTDTQVNLWDNSLWFQRFEPTRERTSGATTIAVAPQADFSAIFFTVRPESTAVYERRQVLGVSFWLNSGSNGIATDELAVAMAGSNELPYWSAIDRSVFPDDSGAFSETRLYFLKINRTIPANTWVNLVLWLDDLEFDPPYRYVTGFYIKHDIGFRNTYYIDQVALLMAP
ncbi:MAG: hypothetical protein DYG89_08590 [Caldilinea sp. CFX5]|nr:hypothetical protein [Caldilinea sp. CFX5]